MEKCAWYAGLLGSVRTLAVCAEKKPASLVFICNKQRKNFTKRKLFRATANTRTKPSKAAHRNSV